MKLKSRIIRAAVAESRTRIIDVNPITNDEKDWRENGLLGLISKIAKKAWVVIWRAVSRFSFTDAVSWISAGFGFVYNFNFNISEKEVNAQIEAAWIRIAGLAGAASGKFIGTLTAKTIGYATVMAIFPASVAVVLKAKIASDLSLKLAQEIGQIIKLVAISLAQAGGLFIYGKIRQAIKGSDKEYLAKLKKQGLNTEDIAKAMQERDKPWTIRGKVEEFQKFITGDNKAAQAFVENFGENVGESFIEAGYVVAGVMDEYVASQQNPATLEIEFEPDGTVKVDRV